MSYLCVFRLMAYSCSTGGSIGPCCDKVNITETPIINNCLPKLNSGPKNGIAFELDEYRKRHEICWASFYDWIYQLCADDTSLCVLPTFKVYVGRLEKKISKFNRNKQHNKIQSLMDEPFCHKKKESIVANPLASKVGKSSDNDFNFEVLQDVNKKLVAELHATESALEAQKEETE